MERRARKKRFAAARPLSKIPRLIVCVLLFACTPAPDEDAGILRNINLLIVIDGLRPDYITPELMPNLHALGERGIVGERHTAVFPSVTRVNSASISTGSYPARHGLMHNTMFIADLSDAPFSTGSAAALKKMAESSGGAVLDVPSLAEIIDEHGLRLLVTGSGGSGTTLLQNPHPSARAVIWGAGGLFEPEDGREQAITAVGELAADNAGRTVWSFDAYLHAITSDDLPNAVVIWINEPDSAGHRHGVGAPRTLRAIARVDAEIGRLVEAHEEHDLADRVNIFVTTDHGFSARGGRFDVAGALREAGIANDDITVVGNMVFLSRDDSALLARIVEALQRDSAIGNLYTRPARPGSSEGSVPGTLSTAVIQWDHPRAADVLVSPAWSSDVNEFGFAGATTQRGSGGGHGSDSPYDLQIRLIAAGPDLKRGLRSEVPTGNVDLAPTILHLLGIKPPAGMSGRVLHELLRDGPSAEDVRVHEHRHTAAVELHDGFRYEAELETLQVGTTVYIRGARTTRRVPAPQ